MEKHDAACWWNLNYDINELTYETKRESETFRTDRWLPRVVRLGGQLGGGLDWEFEITECKLVQTDG